MRFFGKLKTASIDLESGKPCVAFISDDRNVINHLDDIKDGELEIKAEKRRKRRSLDANALLWKCIGEISEATQADKWDIYLGMLQHYGKFTYICVKPNVVDAMKAQWRECEVVGEIDINGKKAVQLLCYFGSSTYDSKEFSRLLDGVISEMQDIGLQPPPSREMREAIERLEKKERGEESGKRIAD